MWIRNCTTFTAAKPSTDANTDCSTDNDYAEFGHSDNPNHRWTDSQGLMSECNYDFAAGVSDCAGIEGDIENTVRTNAQIAGLHDVVATITITNCSAADSATTLTQTSAQRPTSLNFLFQMKSAASVGELVQEGVKATSSSAVAYSAVVSSSNAPTPGQLHFLATKMDSQNTSNTLCSSVNGCTDVTVLAATKVSAVSNQDSLFPGVDSSTNSIIMFAVIGIIVLMLGLIAFITCWCTGACCFAKPGQHEEEEWGTHAKYAPILLALYFALSYALAISYSLCTLDTDPC